MLAEFRARIVLRTSDLVELTLLVRFHRHFSERLELGLELHLLLEVRGHLDAAFVQPFCAGHERLDFPSVDFADLVEDKSVSLLQGHLQLVLELEQSVSAPLDHLAALASHQQLLLLNLLLQVDLCVLELVDHLCVDRLLDFLEVELFNGFQVFVFAQYV